LVVSEESGVEEVVGWLVGKLSLLSLSLIYCARESLEPFGDVIDPQQKAS
jgi:hypothetical protein